MTESDRTEQYVQLLHDGGPTYSGVGWKAEACLGQYTSIRRLLCIGPASRILDVGCGIGFGYNVFHDCDFTGIDTSERHIEVARGLYAGSDAKFRHRKIEDMPNGCADYILMSGIFNIGYGWKEVKGVVTSAYSKATRGVGVGFQYQATQVEGFTTFNVPTWIGLMESLTDTKGWAIDTTIDKMNATIIAVKQSDEEV